jgi:FtsZ-binding cell division protein ZapB
MNKETEGGRTTSTINLKQADIRELKEKREKAMERGDMQAVERIDKQITEKSKKFLLYYKNVIGD